MSQAHSAAMTPRRVLIALAALVLVPVGLLAIGVAVLQSEWAERWIEKRVAERTGREVEIDGIDVVPGWPPGVDVARLRIGNPAWAKSPNLVDAHGLHARVEVLPLLRGKLVMPLLSAQKARAGLEVDGERATWRFGEDERGESPFLVRRVDLDDGEIVYRDAGEGTDLVIGAKGSTGTGGELSLAATGRFRGEPAKATATVPSLDPSPSAPVRLVGKASVGRTQVSVDGSFATSLDTIDMQLVLAGSTMRDLRKVTGAELPDTPPYRIAGHLRHSGTQWVLDPFEGKVGDSDLAGSVTYRTGGERRSFHGTLRSRLLDLDDLGPVVGTPPKTGPGETASAEQRQKAAAQAKKDEVAPDKGIDTSRWSTLDVDVTLDAKRVMRPQAVPIDALAVRAVLKDGALRLDPLVFAVAGGKVKGHAAIDARVKPLRGSVELDVQGLRLERLFPQAGGEQASLGTLYGRARLSGQGASIDDMLGASNGTVSLAVDGGQVSLLLVELLGLDVAEALTLLGTRNRKITLRCAVADLAVQDGIATPQAFVIDTSDTVVGVEGSAHLGRERLDFVFHPEPKDPSIFALRSPIELKGTFKDPEVRPRMGPIVARVGAAALLAAVNPLLAILPFIETGPGKDTNCGALVAQVQAKGAVRKTP
jgi:uncharacterized protein involved in outer membrane biogenesis